MLKKIEEYTQEELLKLTTDQVETIIKLHLADAGIKFPTKPVEPTYFEIPEPDTVVWQVTVVEVYFSKKEVAEETAKLLRNNLSTLCKRDWSSDYDHMSFSNASSDYNFTDGIQVKEVRGYSKELLTQLSSKIANNKRMKEEYEKDQTAYNEAFEAAKEIMDTVRKTVAKAEEEQNEKERLLSHFNEYLVLADNNADIAWKFMKKAYSVSQEQEDYINANIKKK